MIIKPSELPKYSVIEWGGLLYVKYEDDTFVCINPSGWGHPFLVADDPLTKPMQYLNMSGLPSDRFFNNNFKHQQWSVVSLPIGVVSRLAEDYRDELALQYGNITTEELILEAVEATRLENRAKANEEGAGPASPSEDEGKPGEV